MWEQGDSSKIEASRAFLNYDCKTSELCILVNTTTDEIFLEEEEEDSNMWLRIYPTKNPQEPLGGGQVQTIRDDSDRIIAWEACYSWAPTCEHKVQIHANFYRIVDESVVGGRNRTTSTGKPAQNSEADASIALDLHCLCDNDEVCKIDPCYEPSTCSFVKGTEPDPEDSSSTIPVGVCAYDVVRENCCVNDEGCDGDTCGIDETGTGTCQHNGPTPLPTQVPTVHPGPTTPSPTGEGGPVPTPLPTFFDACINDDDCGIGGGHSDCAAATCNDPIDAGNTCGVGYKNTGLPCKGSDSEDGNTCYQPVCESIYCVDRYLAVDAICTSDTVNECVDYKCQAADGADGRTTCVGVPKLKDTKCNATRASNGTYSRLNLYTLSHNTFRPSSDLTFC